MANLPTLSRRPASTETAPANVSNEEAVIKDTLTYDKPVTFYALAIFISWGLWLVAAYLSHLPEQSAAVRVCMAILSLVGLAAPAAVAAWLIWDQPTLMADVRRRLLWRPGTPAVYIASALLLLPLSLVAAQAVSLLFGYSAEQFMLRGGFTFSSGLLPVWFILLLAPALEELAWHGYGTDALVSRMRLFSASMLFTLIWTLWHVPLAFIKGYYQAEIVAEGWLHALNFPLSMVAFVLLMNWLYFRSGRSITLTIIFHTSANFVNEIFMTHPDTKLIQTVLVLILSAIIVWRERTLFFAKPTRKDGDIMKACALSSTTTRP